jgi:hypothetical protein
MSGAASPTRAQLYQLRRHSGKKRRALGDLDPGQADDNTLLGTRQQFDRFAHSRRRLWVAHRNSIVEPRIIAFRIDHAVLEATLGEAFENAGRDRRFAAA